MDSDSQSKRGYTAKSCCTLLEHLWLPIEKLIVFYLKVLAPPKTLRFIYEHFVYRETGLLHSSDGIKK